MGGLLRQRAFRNLCSYVTAHCPLPTAHGLTLTQSLLVEEGGREREPDAERLMVQFSFQYGS